MFNIEQACDKYVSLMLEKDNLKPEKQQVSTEPPAEIQEQNFDKTLRLWKKK